MVKYFFLYRGNAKYLLNWRRKSSFRKNFRFFSQVWPMILLQKLNATFQTFFWCMEHYSRWKIAKNTNLALLDFPFYVAIGSYILSWKSKKLWSNLIQIFFGTQATPKRWRHYRPFMTPNPGWIMSKWHLGRVKGCKNRTNQVGIQCLDNIFGFFISKIISHILYGHFKI